MSIINFNDLYEKLEYINLDESTKNDISEAKRRLTISYQHLIKWRYNPIKQSHSWIYTIREDRQQLKELLSNTNVYNAMNNNEVMNKCFKDGIKEANKEYNNIPINIERDLDIDDVTNIDFLYKYMNQYAKDDMKGKIQLK